MSQDKDNTTAVPASRYLANIQKAEKLLATWQAGDAEALCQFTKFHPQGKQKGFVPNLSDARLVVSSDNVRLKDLKLEPLKKQAKKLLKHIQANDPTSLERLSSHYPQLSSPSPETIRLADCQFIIAHELGLSSWAKLKQHINAVKNISHAIANNTQPDKQRRDARSLDPDTLHIRCGNDIKDTLPNAGFSGTFFEIEEVFVVGSLQGGAASDPTSFFRTRAHFLSSTFADMPPPPGKPDHDMRLGPVLAGLVQDRARLKDLIKQHDTLCLWFEHDSHDQLILAMLLHLLKTMNVDKKVEIVSPHKFPGLKRFVGLGQLSQNPEMIRLLWQQRQPVSLQHINEGAKIWQALCAPDPTPLKTLADQQLCLPHMAQALLWHLDNLPGQYNGLSKVEENTLKILQRDGQMFLGKLFHFYNYETDPLPTLGDVVYCSIVENMINAKRPAIRYTSYDPKALVHKRGNLELTQTGHALLKEEVNWLNLNKISRWVGGVHVRSGKPHWWRDQYGSLIYK